MHYLCHPNSILALSRQREGHRLLKENGKNTEEDGDAEKEAEHHLTDWKGLTCNILAFSPSNWRKNSLGCQKQF